jgi:methyltransferase (TIGR00027 family)
MRKIVGATVYRVVQILLFPFAAVGYVVFVAKLVAYSRRSGASATVLGSLYTRYMQHKLGTRPDEPAARLMKVMPSVPHLGLYLVTVPSLLAHRLTGYVPGIYRYPYEGVPPMMHQSASRTTFDQAVDRHIRGIDQLVILGAGFDTRACRVPADARVRCFEIDEPKTQVLKREIMKKVGVDTTQATYVPADFQKEDWFEKLVNAGFEPEKASLFTWESVTMYLDRQTVESSLRKIAGTAGDGVVAFDYLSAEFIESRSLFMRYARAVINATGEPWHFGLDNAPPGRERVAEFVDSCGLMLDEQCNFGLETDRKRAMVGFATAIVPSSPKR